MSGGEAYIPKLFNLCGLMCPLSGLLSVTAVETNQGVLISLG